MFKRKAAALAIASMIQSGLGEPVGADPIKCDAAATTATASEAFDAFCGRCHKAEGLSAKYFAGLTADEAVQREGKLATFLDRHSTCPHQHHEKIAAWLRELAKPK